MIGSQIGSYKILDKLGEGGMGVVYKAVDTSLDRVVAIKALSAELAHNPDLEKRFRAEAKAQANLNHTNIATLYAFLVQDGGAWMVMEYIEGESIADMISRRGVIPWQEAIPVFKQALLGIGYAHRMGIVHRDIKPSNIMVNRAGIVKVMDFGIAKVMGNRGMTRTGTQMGTAYYMSPEQVLNRGVDIRSDVYSLGVTLYEMLTANVPFTGDTDFEVMQAHMQTPPPLPTRFYPYIPKGIENAILHAMEKEQAGRFQTVEEFGAALEHPEDYQAAAPGAVAPGAAMAGATRLEANTQTIRPPAGTASNPGIGGTMGTPVATPPPTPPPPPVPKPLLLASRNAKIAAGAGAVVVLAIVGFLARPKPQPTPAPPTAGQYAPQTAASQPQGQVDVPVPLPPPSDNPQPEEKKKAPQAAAAPPSAPPAQTRQQPAQASAAPPKSATSQPQARAEGSRGVSVPAAPPAPAATAAAPPPAPAPEAAAGSPVTIPAGTRITIRTIGMASTRSSKEGDSIAASVDAPVAVGGRTAIPRGADATLRVASLADGIVLDLTDISMGGRHYQASAAPYTPESAGTKDKKGNKVGGIFRHLDPLKKRGGSEQASVVAPESRITFTLKQPLDVVAP
jgi:predicted Ser/Thr protein kinase